VISNQATKKTSLKRSSKQCRTPPNFSREHSSAKRELLFHSIKSTDRSFVLSVILHLALFAFLAGLRINRRNASAIKIAASRNTTEQSVKIESVKLPVTEPMIPVEQESPAEIMEANISIDIQSPTPVNFERFTTHLDNSAPANRIDPKSSFSAPEYALTLQTFADQSPTNSEQTFHGIPGNGNHIVYIIDSSKSMGSRFYDAKKELIRSVKALQSTQRVYIIFYDEKLHLPVDGDGGRVSSLINATQQNCDQLVRWAETVSMASGGSPARALQYALKLRPDVIYLLSDGEFAAEIAEETTRANWRPNGFGEKVMRSVIHTINYGRIETGQSLRLIAKQNGGQHLLQ